MEFAGLVLAAIATSAAAMRRAGCEDPAVMPPSFVFDFASLLLLGPHAAALVAAAGSLTPLAVSRRSQRLGRILLNTATVIVATEIAGVVYRAPAGVLRDTVWLWQAVPVAAAVLAYCFVKSLSADVVAPLITRRRVSPFRAKRVLGICPNYFIGAGLAAGLAAAIDRGIWEAVVAAAIPVYFAYRAYCEYANRLGEEYRRREVIESLGEGMCVLDGTGRVTLWNDALERIVGCPRARALERSLVSAVPALGNTELRRAIDEAAAGRNSRTIIIQLASGGGPRILQVDIRPVVGGVTLLWHDVTDRIGAERELRRSEERLALAAEGANDGLWEWDLRTREFYFSGRWRVMMGLPAAPGIGRPEEWTGRIHPDDVGPLKEALEAHLAGKTDCLRHEHRIRHEDGTYRWFLCRGVAVRGAGRRPARIAGSLTDTTDRVIAQERLRSAGFVDPLTGLCNRTVFVEGLGRRLEQLKQRRLGGWFAVLYLDLDRFKVVNDSLGHLVGDELLVKVSRRLETCLRSGDVLARLGGDEFAILLDRLGDEQQANAIAFRIQEALSAPFSIDSREVFTSASIGIAFGVAQYATPDEIMRDADTAMYHAKSRGKARHELFDADMHARARNRLGLENDLRRAINGNDFEVHYQPIVSLASGVCVGFESLVRWTRNGEAISPATFIPIAEELGLIEPLGTWVLQQACRTFADWQRRFPDRGLEYITVNASSRQLLQQTFLRIIEEAVTTAGLKPSDLRIEITETALMDSPNLVADVLRELRDFGVKIYLDDFGTGYSSLSHLHKLPVDALKIDHSFVRSLLLPDRPAIVESILGLARTLNTGVVAEGIESDMQARELQRLGCTHAQGFLFSRPLSTRAAEDLLVAGQPLGPKFQEADGDETDEDWSEDAEQAGNARATAHAQVSV
ncbi:MAG: putative bifunctional diguanylate cyclase/phosphodiesterase [Betaproteobacteria bacterium]